MNSFESSPQTEPLLGSRRAANDYGAHDASRSLLPDCETGGHPSLHGTENDFKYNPDHDSDSDSCSGSESESEHEIKKKRAERLRQVGGWRGYLKDFTIFAPYLIPRNEPRVQICILVSLVTLAGQRVLNVAIPHQLGVIADKLLDREPPYRELLIWLMLSILNEKSGLGLIQELVKVPIKQFSERRVTDAAFSHVMNLSMGFHSERDSAEVMKALEQGGALMNIMETAVNEILPTVVDLTMAIGILYWKFGIYAAVPMVFAFASFLGLEITSSRWNIEPRRQSAKADREQAKVMHQAVQGWTTVSHFNKFDYERRRFGQALDAKLKATWIWSLRNICTEGLVELLEPFTFFTLSCIVFYEVSHGRATTGDFVFLVEYWGYLIWPLKFLSQNYRWMMADLIDAERLLYLMQAKPTIIDSGGAYPIGHVEGNVAFENVRFSYDSVRDIVQGVSFSALPGQTVAIVCATGAGKSSVAKLLFRFYDVTGGRITVDGHDIRDITLDSLRNTLGVVPQSPMLFNGTIMDNLRYARLSATDEEIYSACRAAAIHESITGFPDGYGTKVSEQGMKLSGGETQRLAIARIILRDPQILVLDEATSAVDTNTESMIQSALEAFESDRKRTTFVIAHRLSTIVGADQILVMDKGLLVEKGTHEELLKTDTMYKRLWSKQLAL
ncbi:Heavy metal tolerance protein like [Verticillium longisporum]|uniref:Heavy metal tolerance protein like n=1 Tax=Verticillium longisporum TaxID=100787 RepID=A0A8I3AJ43_VERLO|nr:Heavy metal tolerance protein like [Verticillium longisporum]KAG7129641.1 Heavy metal tolerance protein like [Verticillium longisporum]